MIDELQYLLHTLISGDAAVMGQNGLLFMGGMLVGTRYLLKWEAWSGYGIDRRMALGIWIAGYSLAIHRGFWWVWRFLRAIGEDQMAEIYVSHADWLLVPVVGMTIGYVIHLEAWSQKAFRGWHRLGAAAVSIAIYVMFALPGIIGGT